VFRGVNHLNLDAKGRLAVPSRYRERLAEACAGRLILTVDRDGCLLLYPQGEWERIEQNLMSRPNIDPNVRRLQRLLLGHATECEIDAQGRILLPTSLREFAALDKRAVLVGQGNKFEIWDEEAWVRQREAWVGDEGAGGDLSAALDSLSL
jgi:MraZ protein